jgi:hypothetical protein
VAATPPTGVAPGTATGSTYPQWGVAQSGSTYTVKEATSAAAKQTDIDAGYLVWFTSESAAKNYISSETSLLNGQVPTELIPGLPQIGDFFGALTDANTWIRLAKVVFGGVLLIIGIAHITGASGAVADIARKVPLPI